ncbi:MAG TPA: glycosyltransferase [Gemmatimonadaceae bacterium]|nr:glycosyltransferase [Gemmatimonadaceae bacterium]
MRDVRVLQVGKYYPPDEGGMETHLEGLCRVLRDYVTLDVVVASHSAHTTNEVIDGVPVTRMATIATVRSAPICPTLPWRIRSARADIVHLHHPNPSAFASYLASGHRGPLVVTYHSDVVQQQLLNVVYEPIVRGVLRRADAVIVSSTAYMRGSPMLQRHSDRCVEIPMAIDPAAYATADPAAVARIRQAYGDRIVLAVGRLVYYKGLEYLIRAMSRVDARLVIVGQGPMRAALEAEARSVGVADRVTFVGHVADTTPWYHAASVFALPSHLRSEAFGIVQLEAMASGIPVVNTNIPSGVPEVSRDGETGLTVPPADPQALAAAINRLLNDPGLRHTLGVAGRQRVAEEFSLQSMGERTRALYADVSARHASRSRRRGRD